MEGVCRFRQIIDCLVHPSQGIREDYVEATTSIHEDLGHGVVANLGIEYKGSVPWSVHCWRVILSVEGNWNFGSFQKFWNSWWRHDCHVDVSSCLWSH
jgi:hypothetical protein